MSVARTSAMLMSILVGACVTSAMPTVTHGNETYQLITGERLRSTVMGKIVTFPSGQAVTGCRSYIFSDDGSSVACGGGGQDDYGPFVVSNDRVCAVNDGSLCWQFFRSRTAGYLIRHVAIIPGVTVERVCIEPWMRAVEACRLPSPTG